ncbi:MAG: DUF1552 domain-containing protein [Armatimonadaceae bacterium]
MNQRIERRTFLRGAGTLLALPLLDSMLPLSALAQSAKASDAPKRIAFLFVPNGAHMADWTPKQFGTNFELPYILEPLKGVYKSLNVLTGLTQHQAHALGDGGGDHARSAAAWLTGCHPRKTAGANIKAGISADQIAAQRIGRQTRFPSLELGCERGGLAGDCDSGYSCAYSSTIAWRTESTPVAKETNPRLVFERFFGGLDQHETAQARELRIATDKSILDFVMEDAAALKRKLGVEDQRKLEEYFVGVREVEQRIAWTEKAGKEGAQGMPGGMAVPQGVPSDYAEHIRLMGDMMILAFQADLTRVSTFMFANEGSNRSYRNIGIAEGHHELSHHGKSHEKQEKIRQINRFHVEQVAYILNKMQSTKEGSGSLLDNTLLVYGGGISDGDRHNHDDLPLILAGGAAMGVKGGRHLQYKNGTPMTNLFLTMLDKVGVPADTVGTIGDSTGRLQIV